MIKVMSYWNNDGPHQKEYELIWDNHIPNRGQAEDYRAEAVNLISGVYYDLYNNGMCNWNPNKKHSMQTLVGIVPPEIKEKVKRVLAIIPDQDEDDCPECGGWSDWDDEECWTCNNEGVVGGWFYLEDAITARQYKTVQRLLEELADEIIVWAYKNLYGKE